MAIHSLAYHRCSSNINRPMGGLASGPSSLRALLKNALLRPSSARPLSGSTLAEKVNRPSDSRGPEFRGESPHRTVMDVGVFSTTSKWSVMTVPGS